MTTQLIMGGIALAGILALSLGRKGVSAEQAAIDAETAAEVDALEALRADAQAGLAAAEMAGDDSDVQSARNEIAVIDLDIDAVKKDGEAAKEFASQNQANQDAAKPGKDDATLRLEDEARYNSLVTQAKAQPGYGKYFAPPGWQYDAWEGPFKEALGVAKREWNDEQTATKLGTDQTIDQQAYQRRVKSIQDGPLGDFFKAPGWVFNNWVPRVDAARAEALEDYERARLEILEDRDRQQYDNWVNKYKESLNNAGIDVGKYFSSLPGWSYDAWQEDLKFAYDTAILNAGNDAAAAAGLISKAEQESKEAYDRFVRETEAALAGKYPAGSYAMLWGTIPWEMGWDTAGGDWLNEFNEKYTEASMLGLEAQQDLIIAQQAISAVAPPRSQASLMDEAEYKAAVAQHEAQWGADFVPPIYIEGNWKSFMDQQVQEAGGIYADRVMEERRKADEDRRRIEDERYAREELEREEAFKDQQRLERERQELEKQIQLEIDLALIAQADYEFGLAQEAERLRQQEYEQLLEFEGYYPLPQVVPAWQASQAALEAAAALEEGVYIPAWQIAKEALEAAAETEEAFYIPFQPPAPTPVPTTTPTPSYEPHWTTPSPEPVIEWVSGWGGDNDDDFEVVYETVQDFSEYSGPDIEDDVSFDFDFGGGGEVFEEEGSDYSYQEIEDYYTPGFDWGDE